MHIGPPISIKTQFLKKKNRGLQNFLGEIKLHELI